MRNLLTVERAVIESLSRTAKTIGELEYDTGISSGTLQYIVNDMIECDLVRNMGQRYHLQQDNDFTQSQHDFKREVKRVIGDFVESSSNVHLQKVWLTSYERIIFEQLMEKVNQFVERVKGKNDQGLKTEFQEVIVWGHSTYQKLISNSLTVS